MFNNFILKCNVKLLMISYISYIKCFYISPCHKRCNCKNEVQICNSRCHGKKAISKFEKLLFLYFLVNIHFVKCDKKLEGYFA
jgi:hypothetical protein